MDTNVVVAGLLSPFGPPGQILGMIASASHALCFDARILTEYSDVLRRPKFPFHDDPIQALMDHITATGIIVAGTPLPVRLPDPADEVFLQAALAGKARCLITGNLKHFPLPSRQGMRIMAPRDFLEWYRKTIQSRPRAR